MNMSKEKFQLPFLDDERVDREVQMIISRGMKPRQSFFSFMWDLQKELGFRYLFANPRDGVFLILSVTAVLLFLTTALSEGTDQNHVYGALFLISPLLFMALSLYDLFHKRQSAVFEVEMTAKYTLYQVSAFRMLHFSVLSILMNVAIIAFLVWNGHSFEFLRAFMISMTALFIFSIVFLMIFTRGRSVLAVLKAGGGWVGVNILLGLIDQQAYTRFLMTIPVVVYAVVLAVSIICFIYYLSKLVRMRPAEGVL